MVDGDGTAELLTPPQRDAQLEIAQRQVGVYCTAATDAAMPADGAAPDPAQDASQADDDAGDGTADRAAAGSSDTGV